MAGHKRNAASAGLTEHDARGRKIQAGNYNTSSGPEDMFKFYTSLIEFLRYKMSAEQLMPFEVLPSRNDYPDYYVTISNPISLKDIETNFINRKYTSSADIIKDFDVLCNNAQTYNARFSAIYATSVQLHSVVHQFWTVRSVPAQYKLYAGEIIDIESKLVLEMENYKPRVKNARFLCEPFIDTPSESHNPELLSRAQSSPMSTSEIRRQLFEGRYMNPVKFKDAFEGLFMYVRDVYDPKGSSGDDKKYQDAIGLQRSFTARYDKYIKNLTATLPNGYEKWASKFIVKSPESLSKSQANGSVADTQQPSPVRTRRTSLSKENGSNLTSLQAPAGRTTTRSAWNKQIIQESNVPDNESSSPPSKPSGLKIKFKPGPSSPAPPLKLRLKSSDKQDNEVSQSPEKAKTSTPKIKLSFRSSSRNKQEPSANSKEADTSPNSASHKASLHLKNSASSESITAEPKTRASRSKAAAAENGDSTTRINDSPKGKSKSKAGRPSSKKEDVVMLENPVSKSEDDEDSVEMVSEDVEPVTNDTATVSDNASIATEKAEASKTQSSGSNVSVKDRTKQVVVLPKIPDPVYPNPTRRLPTADITRALLRDVTFSSIIPAVTKYQQSKNLVPPGSQLSSIQLKFPVSPGFLDRSFSLWVPYYHHTFALNALLNEWLNSSSYKVDLWHNKSLVQPFKKSDISPWATQTEPIMNRYEIRLVTGLNLIELVVVAQTQQTDEKDSSSTLVNGVIAGTNDKALSSENSSSNSAAGGALNGSDSVTPKNGESLATRNSSALRATRNHALDTVGGVAVSERLTLWITMGNAPYTS